MIEPVGKAAADRVQYQHKGLKEGVNRKERLGERERSEPDPRGEEEEKSALPAAQQENRSGTTLPA